MVNYPKGLITIFSICPMQTSLIDSIWGIPMVYSSYDGVEISWRNNSQKTINYITFTLAASDRVGGNVKTLGNTLTATLKLVGPVKPGQYLTSKSNGFWQHGMTNLIVPYKIDIEFSDGTTTTYQVEPKHTTVLDYYKDTGIGDESTKTVKLGSSANSPCYVATCVYGSYDCPEVWTLRRFRDYKLSKTWFGRVFIQVYYAVSPTIVKWFGQTKWFNNVWKPVLDRIVFRLKSKGYKDTPYCDL